MKTCEESNYDFPTKNFVAILLIINMIYNAFKFMNAEGCGHPLVWSLFNMVLSLGLLVLLCHQKEIMEKKIYLLKQSLMKDFFKRIK